jgi:hypothetical protein
VGESQTLNIFFIVVFAATYRSSRRPNNTSGLVALWAREEFRQAGKLAVVLLFGTQKNELNVKEITMNSIICAIEQEIKYTLDSKKESPQYRAGYETALNAVVEFLPLRNGGQSSSPTHHPAVTRLLSFAPRPIGESLDEKIEKALTESERELLGIALKVIRDDPDGADYLVWWLTTYGLSSNHADLVPNWPHPSTEQELDWLDKAFGLYGTVFLPSC